MQLHRKTLFAAPAALALAIGTVSLFGAGSSEAQAAASTAPAWTIQPGGTLAFSVGNGSDTIGAQFATWGGTINFDPDNPGTAAIHIDVDLTSAALADSFKEGLVQGDEFFGTAATPTATYESQSVEAQPDGRFLAHGTLSLRGMAMPQDIEFRLSGSGNQRHVEGSAAVDRLGYGIGTGSHGNGLDNSVAVNFAFDATRS
jgi:polyisoprenoid-binding protein YceI